MGWRLPALGVLLALGLARPAHLETVALAADDTAATLRGQRPAGTTSGASPVRTVALDIPRGSYLAGAEGRRLLKYLVRCALTAETRAELALPGQKLNFMGDVGLAPEWAERALTLAEQRWVSGCVYALTNKLGKSVLVDLRGTHPRMSADTEEDRRTYSLHEGGFFGNIFLANPVGYVCEGADRKKMLDLPIGKVRLCAQPSGTKTSGGQPLSACGFVLAGPCSSPSSFLVDGERIDEVVHSWLSSEPRD